MPALGIDVKGKLVAAEAAEPGRAIARFSDLALGSRVRECVADAKSRTSGPVFLSVAASSRTR